jgi:hypothetical protein
MMSLRIWMIAGICLLMLSPAPAYAQETGTPTQVMVRAVARDAKIIGSNVGGARITITEAASGKVLAEGEQAGNTGQTDQIVTRPRKRGASIYDTEGAAGFLATLSLSEPTVVQITATGPLGTPSSAQAASKTLLLIPGKDVLGDGVILEIHGFAVELLAPEGPLKAGTASEVRAKVTMQCGCPTEPGGLWNADDIEIVAQLIREGNVVQTALLDYAGEESHYSGSLTPPEAGTYELRVLAMDSGNVNFGRATRDVTVAR